jgi:hypothetical protein
MSRARLIAGWFIAVATFAAVNCKQNQGSDVELWVASLAGSDGTGTGGQVCTPGAGMNGNDVSGVRALARSSGTHLAAYRTVQSSDLKQVSGTPLGNPVAVAGDAHSSSTPWLYQRHDGLAATLYVDIRQHVHEITSSGNVDLFNAFVPNAPLAAPAPTIGAPAPDVIGYVRTDNRSAIVYRSVNNHVIELLSGTSGQPAWLVTDLTAAAGASVTIAKGSAFPFDNHIHELATTGNGVWSDWDITVQTGDFVVPMTDPWAYTRSDDWNTIVFVGHDGMMREFGLYPGAGPWGSWIFPALSPSDGPYSRPSGYIRADGVNAVVYWSKDLVDRIRELTLGPNGWVDAPLPVPCVRALSQLYGHLAPGNRSSVLFRGVQGFQIKYYELSKPVGGAWEVMTF